MPVRLMAADSKIVAARGKMAVMRGPVVYCLEGDDVPTGVAFEHVSVPATVELTPSPSSELGGIVKLGGSLVHAASAPGTAHPVASEANVSTLYRPVRFAPGASPPGPSDPLVPVSLIPYYARLNRSSDTFKIWLPVQGGALTVPAR